MTAKIARHPMRSDITVRILKMSAFMKYSSTCVRNTMCVGPVPRRKKRPLSKRSPVLLTRGTRRSVLDCLCQKFVLLLRHRVVCSTHGETNGQNTRSKEFSTSSFCGKNASKALYSNSWKAFTAW